MKLPGFHNPFKVRDPLWERWTFHDTDSFTLQKFREAMEIGDENTAHLIPQSLDKRFWFTPPWILFWEEVR
jgi:hypothetical protein